MVTINKKNTLRISKNKEDNSIKRFFVLAEVFVKDLDDEFIRCLAEKGLREELGGMVDRISIRKYGEVMWSE